MPNESNNLQVDWSATQGCVVYLKGATTPRHYCSYLVTTVVRFDFDALSGGTEPKVQADNDLAHVCALHADVMRLWEGYVRDDALPGTSL